ncbi:hypothetical protein RISK_006595 [Rhodopirellula islandica]|uniref:Uncharacterized protein n=1 Tax=Rhodopirellula islandica TaxID=595434 RepID=A0A0J1E7J6_RHOIS|nr:hypothetical protein RISK_006595 [Rhodopirellula islandica]
MTGQNGDDAVCNADDCDWRKIAGATPSPDVRQVIRCAEIK